MDLKIKKIGFMGLGVMGASMAGHLLKAGFDLNVYTRTKAKAQDLIDNGAKWCDSPAEAAADCDVVISIVGYPQDVKEVWLGDESKGIKGALDVMKQGSIAVDMTTSAPSLAKELYDIAKLKGINMLDCPVTGGDLGARNATLTILCGGDKEPFAALKPVFETIGKKFELFGDAGKGQLTKACNQIAVGATMFSVCEAIIFAQKMGLDAEQVINTIGSGAAGSFSMNSYGPRILKGDWEPGFKIEHFVKDMKLAIDACKSANLELPCLSLALKCYETLLNGGLGPKGTQALYKYFAK